MTRELNDIMEFDHVIRVSPDGTIDAHPSRTYPLTPHAPESVIFTRHDGQISAADEDAWAERVRAQGWEPERGWTGQYSYSGAFMHASEYVGGHLEDHIRQTPGLWVAVVVSCLVDDADPADEDHDPDDCDTCADRDAAEEEPAGWAVLHMDDGPETNSYVVTSAPDPLIRERIRILTHMTLEDARKTSREIAPGRIVRVTDLAVMPDETS